MVRRDTHDREDIWSVLADADNLADTIEDALQAIRDQDIPWFEGHHRRASA